MEQKPMKILIIEDDIKDVDKLIEASKQRNDIEIVAVTDSDIEALKLVRLKHPEGIILDLELNNGKSGSTDSFEFIENLKNLKLAVQPVIIVTTHINSPRTYDILHRSGVDLILYKDHQNYSCNNVFNRFINLRSVSEEPVGVSVEDELKNREEKISERINSELDLVGITSNLRGRQYIHDAIKFLLENENSTESLMQYLTKTYQRSSSTITNGIQNAITHGWRVSAVEDLEKHYTAKINYQTGLPTPMELIYYYVDKIKKII